MARQFRVQSMDLYSKLGVKTSPNKTRTISIFEDGASTFNLTTPKHKRANSTIPNKPRVYSHKEKNIQSPIKFEKQLPRPDICKLSADVNPNRFLSFNHSPIALTNTKRVSSPNFSLYKGRDSSMYPSLQDQPEYNPNYSPIWKNHERGLVAFNKLQGRKEKRPKSTVLTRDVVYSAIDKKIRSPNLAKATPKPNDPILPAFMLETVTRGNIITDKTLEMNCYKTTNFLPLKSSFGVGWVHTEHISPQPIRGKCPKIVKLLTKTLSPF
ncbi:hypothetical protein SteCoe_28181 [Stentor coeruleus]|uniref:Uncharacterized protein n=1 Tax=Stentor coeruleus TaxID=5963 RepID=A0A1R2B8V0_9CILI|nr:hypothetical protein SteCoe_28181 [Stentor coeruleus]